VASRRRKLYGLELEAQRAKDRDAQRRRRAKLYARGLDANGRPCSRPLVARRVEVEEPHEYVPLVFRVSMR